MTKKGECQEGKPKYAKKYQEKIRKRKLQWLCSHLGSEKIRCDRCRYDTCFRAICLHHLCPEEKENVHDSLGKWLSSYPFEKFQNKILTTNFLLLCANCHAELHAGVWKYGE
jgi:hypothetical protein